MPLHRAAWLQYCGEAVHGSDNCHCCLDPLESSWGLQTELDLYLCRWRRGFLFIDKACRRRISDSKPHCLLFWWSLRRWLRDFRGRSKRDCDSFPRYGVRSLASIARIEVSVRLGCCGSGSLFRCGGHCVGFAQICALTSVDSVHNRGHGGRFSTCIIFLLDSRRLWCVACQRVSLVTLFLPLGCRCPGLAEPNTLLFFKCPVPALILIRPGQHPFDPFPTHLLDKFQPYHPYIKPLDMIRSLAFPE